MLESVLIPKIFGEKDGERQKAPSVLPDFNAEVNQTD